MITLRLAVATIASTVACAPHAIGQSTPASSGWIAFTPHTNLGIYVPVRINGHETMALVYGGPSVIDARFAASIGLDATTDADTSAAVVEVRLGELTVPHISAKRTDLQTQAYVGKILGRPVAFLLGEEVFNRVAVDIDPTHHRIAFLDPAAVSRPTGATEVPLVELDSQRVIPLSIDGAAPEQFELELGNVIGPLLVTPAYAKSHRLLDGRPTSQRLSGPFTETVVSLDHLSFASIDFPAAPIALIPETNLPPASITGGVGLPILANFRLIIDYSHDRLFAIPNGAGTKSIAKDRIGLLLDRKDTTGLSVAFVAPHSPAEAAGFKKGERISLIDGKPFAAWPTAAIIGFHMADIGTTHAFTMPDGTVRRVKAADFF